MDIVTAALGLPGLALGGKMLGAATLIYLLGLFRGSSPYRWVRNALGKFSENAGIAISRIGNSKLKGVYEPFEAVAVDFFLFMAEQLAVGLRKDNPGKDLPEHLERLRGVGSISRAKAIRDKMESFVKDVQDARVRE